MSTPIFSINDKGHPIPQLPGEPDGKNRLSAEQAAEITGDAAESLLREWMSVYGRLLTDDAPEIVDGNVTLDPAKVQDAKDDTLEVLRDRYFPKLCLEDVMSAVRFAKKRDMDAWSGHFWGERIYEPDRKTTVLHIGLRADGFRHIAQQDPNFAGMDEVAFEYGPDGQLEKAVSTVYRFSQGQRVPVTASALYSNFYPGPGMGWDERPETRLGVCARNASIREAFGGKTAGLYDRDEMARTFSGGKGNGPRPPDREQDSSGGDAPTDRTQFECGLVTDFGVKDERQRGEILQRLRNQFSHLSEADPERFYARAWRAVCVCPKAYGLERKAGASAATA